MTKRERELTAALERVQYLVGKANGAYQNDRLPERWKMVVGPLDEAFNLCIEVLSNEKKA